VAVEYGMDGVQKVVLLAFVKLVECIGIKMSVVEKMNMM
jgi:hypothetical protein